MSELHLCLPDNVESENRDSVWNLESLLHLLFIILRHKPMDGISAALIKEYILLY